MNTLKMRYLRFALLLVFLAGLLVILAFFLIGEDEKPILINNTPVPPFPALSPVRVAEGAGLYAQQCASCHGENLQGAPDWKKPLPDGSLPPPPHDGSGHTWHHPDSLLIDIIANGGDPSYNSKMPAFSGRLFEDEIASILDYIKSRWGKDEREFQWWITYTQDRS